MNQAERYASWPYGHAVHDRRDRDTEPFEPQNDQRKAFTGVFAARSLTVQLCDAEGGERRKVTGGVTVSSTAHDG
ncbi:hypothetical protein [Streptomyces venezuelae]|uniref:hypothetical protein n=1 Tax=Streptomyces venezuelae TaxID=54571 RepID=UPI00365B2022